MRNPVLALSGLASLYQVIWLWTGGGLISPVLIAVILWLNLVFTQSGHILLNAASRPLLAHGPASYIIGYTFVSVAILIVSLLGASPALALVLISAVFLAVAFRSAKGGTRRPEDGTDITIAFVMALMVTALAYSSMSSVPAIERTGTLSIWSDTYLHAVSINSFGSQHAFGGDLMLAGVDRNFYHYAPYMMPAVLAETTGSPGLVVAAACLLPIGLWVAGLGLYAFTAQLAGRAAGLLAVSLLVLVPDPARYFIRAGYLDFDWLIFTTPGAGYGIGVCLVATALAHAGWTQGRRVWVLFAAGFLLFAILQRVQMFMLAAPALAGTAVWGLGRSMRRVLCWGAMAAVIGFVSVIYLLPGLARMWGDWAQSHEYIDIVLRSSHGYISRYEPHIEYGPSRLPVQLALILTATLGVYLVVLTLLAATKILRKRFEPSDILPFFLVLSYFGLILFAPMGENGDDTEFRHRHFVLLYMYWVGFGAAWLTQLTPPRIVWAMAAVTGAAALTFCLLMFGQKVDAPDLKSIPWAKDFYGTQSTPGVIPAAEFLLNNAAPGDVIAVGPGAARLNISTVSEITSLAGIPVFLGRADLKALQGGCVAGLVSDRLAMLDRIALAPDWAQAAQLLRDAGVRWYISVPGDRPAWSAQSDVAAFVTKGVVIYDSGVYSQDPEMWRSC